ncbi:hypothetical protein AAE478_007306 [Parahypoxylon ruwenzoriense]
MAPKRKRTEDSGRKGTQGQLPGDSETDSDREPVSRALPGKVMKSGRFRCDEPRNGVQCGSKMKNDKHNISSHKSKMHNMSSKYQKKQAKTGRYHCLACGKDYANFNSILTHGRDRHGFSGNEQSLMSYLGGAEAKATFNKRTPAKSSKKGKAPKETTSTTDSSGEEPTEEDREDVEEFIPPPDSPPSRPAKRRRDDYDDDNGRRGMMLVCQDKVKHNISDSISPSVMLLSGFAILTPKEHPQLTNECAPSVTAK